MRASRGYGFGRDDGLLSEQETWLATAVGDTICVHYNNKKYYIDITEAKPQDAISVIETDCEVRLMARPRAKCCAIFPAVVRCVMEMWGRLHLRQCFRTLSRHGSACLSDGCSRGSAATPSQRTLGGAEAL